MNYMRVALYNGAHEVSYFYYKRELYPREIGAWDVIKGGYKSRVRVCFDLGKEMMKERDSIFYDVNAFALFSDTPGCGYDPFYYDQLTPPLKISRNVRAEILLAVYYEEKFKGMAGIADTVLRHELLGLPAVYNQKGLLNQMILRTRAEIATHADTR